MRMKSYLLILLTILTTWYLSDCQSVSTNITDYRLPTNIYPISYKLLITTYLPGYKWVPDEKSLTYEGVVIIDLEVKESTDQIVMHSDSIEIIYALLLTNSVKITKWNLTSEHQIITFYLNQSLEKDTNIQILIDFRGKLRNDERGFYLTESSKNNGETMINAITQFETTDARLMVPCFDEPEFKATWQVQLKYPTGAVALSNTIELETSVNEHFTTTDFKTTVKMSSYLLALFVGDVQYKEIRTDKGLRIRVYADPETVEHVDHALIVSRLTVEGYEKLFGIDFPMEKLDFISVYQFSAGAMENWGLIVHRPSTLIGSSETVTEVVIHELAHQWFGNLVTMKFWNQVWLNEGFANYMTSYGYSFVYSDFDFDFYFVNEQDNAKMDENGMTLNSVQHEDDGNIGIASLNYPKGSSFIRMLEKIIGTENFMNGIRLYLSENSYSNTEDTDLYEALETFHNKSENIPTLKEFGRCWTHQDGFPTIHVERVNGKVILTQRNDRVNDSSMSECGYKWDIPIWYQTFGNENIEMEWFTKDKNELELNVEVPLIINANSYGYYDVVYSDDSYLSIAAEFKNNSQIYSDSTKYRVLSDATRLSINGEVSLQNLFYIADFLTDSNNYVLSNFAKTIKMSLSQESENTTESDLEIMRVSDSRIKADGNKTELKKHKTKFSEGSAFEGCKDSETFSNCYEKKFKMIYEACNSVMSHKNNQTSNRLIEWLKTEESIGNKEKILELLNCGFKDILKRVLKDETYNWPQYIQRKFALLFKENGNRKSDEMNKSPKFRSFFDFDHLFFSDFNRFLK